MSVGELRAQMAGQLRKSGVDPDAKVVFGESPKGGEAAAVPVPAVEPDAAAV